MTQAANLGALGTNVSTSGIAQAAGGGTAGTAGVTGFKNRVINGAMVISQRGTSFSSPNNYTLDRFAFANTGGQTYTVTQSSAAPAGFTNSLSMTNTNSVVPGTTNYQVLYQVIEGYNIADLAWGTASAKTVSVSFWVNSSVTGSYGLVLRGGAAPTYYVLSYSIPVANTWTYITLTAPGPTTDTWNITTANGIALYFDLGVGSTYSASVTGSWATGNIFGLTGGTKFSTTNGATFYITGVQLEVGTAATNFDVRSYGTELALCQRYFWEIDGSLGLPSIGAGMAISSTAARIHIQHPVSMRATPTYAFSGTLYILRSDSGGQPATSIAVTYAGLLSSMIQVSVASGLVAGNGTLFICDNASSNFFTASSEL